MYSYSFAVVLALLMGSGQAMGQSSWADQAEKVPVDGAGQRFCDALQPVPLPAADQPTAAEAKALGSKCDAIALYEGLGQPPDYRKARLCAYVERDTSNDVVDPFTGDGVLMMIYANGHGVPRNVPLAKQLACRIWAAPAEMDLRQEHLDAIASGKVFDEFNICDDITSGMMEGSCAGEASRATDLERNRRLDKLSVGWSGDAKQAFGRLRKAAGAFSESSSGNEEDMSGTARGALAQARSDMLDDEFEKTLVDFVAGKFPAGTDDPQADEKLNTTYQHMLTAFAIPEMSLMTIRPEGLRETQRLWLRYRDAWLDFARVLKPTIDRAPLMRALTAQRTKQLEDVSTEYAE